jgi:hypothetical protein
MKTNKQHKSKGERLNWQSIKKSTSMTLNENVVHGMKITTEELRERRTPYVNVKLLVP